MKCAIANGDTIPIRHQPQIDKDGIDFFDGSGCSIDTTQMNQSRTMGRWVVDAYFRMDC
jgi:hypothetical protein